MKKAENYSDLEKENNIRYMIKGMDLSSNQGKVDFFRIKESGISFVMIRCGYGKNVESQDDFYFERETTETFVNYRNSILKMILEKLNPKEIRNAAACNVSGVVLEYWNTPVSWMMPVYSASAISLSISSASMM